MLIGLGFSAASASVTAQDLSSAEILELSSQKDVESAERLAINDLSPMSLLSADSIQIGGERQSSAAYLRVLNKRIAQRPEWVARELNVGLEEISTLNEYLDRIEDKDRLLTKQRLSAMCDIWEMAVGSMSELDRANLALAEYSRLEAAELYSNELRQNFLYDVAEALGSEVTALIRAQMREFGVTYQANYYSWEGMVQSVGIQVKQLKFNCE
jgi:hypothetical protein